MVQQKENIDQQIFLLHEQIANTEDQIATYRLLIADTQVELEEAQTRLEELNEQYKDRIRAMEEDGRMSYWSVLFKANSFSDLLDRLSMVQEIAASDNRRLDELKTAAQAVNDAQNALKEEKAALEQIRQEQETTYAQLEEKRIEAERLLDELEDMGVEYENMMDDGELLQQQLAEQIAQAEKDYDAAKYLEWLATSVPPTTAPPPTTVPPTTKPTETPADPTEPKEEPTKPTEEEKDESSDVVWRSPLLRSSYVTSAYGMRYHPISGKYKMHHGVDLYSFEGDPIVATRGGVVTTADYQAGGAGYYVTINHGDGFSSTYMHMTHYEVKKGDYVTAGQVIGYVGSTGGSTGPHLHFGIFYNGSSVNPVDYVNFA
jgi:murein DD-endopeptidase MepM/ murein hydrolase activator NlpD